MYKKGNVARVQVLVLWEGLTTNEATWADFDEFTAKFRDFVF